MSSQMMKYALGLGMMMVASEAMNNKRFSEMDGIDKYKKSHDPDNKVGSLEIKEPKQIEPKYITKFGEGKKQFVFVTEICEVEIWADTEKSAYKKLVTVEGRNYEIRSKRRRLKYEPYPTHCIKTPLTDMIEKENQRKEQEPEQNQDFQEMTIEDIQKRDEDLNQLF